MVKPRYITNEVIIPKPGPKRIKDESFFIGHVPYEEETTDIQVEVERCNFSFWALLTVVAKQLARR